MLRQIVVYDTPIKDNLTEIQLPGVAKGVSFVTLSTESVRYTEKIIIH